MTVQFLSLTGRRLAYQRLQDAAGRPGIVFLGGYASDMTGTKASFLAEKCAKAGIQFCHHNHDFEFAAQGGVYPYDILLGQTDPKLVKMELDLYWATKAGQDPVKLFEAHPGRFPLWHLKDMDNTPDHKFTEVGNGTIDFKRIFAHKATAGMKYWFVEQDKCPGSPFDSITKSINYST